MYLKDKTQRNRQRGQGIRSNPKLKEITGLTFYFRAAEKHNYNYSMTSVKSEQVRIPVLCC